MISLVSKCNQFYKIFNKQDLNKIRNLLSNDIVLENSKGLIIANGINDFLEQNLKLFSKVESIVVCPLKLYVAENKISNESNNVNGTVIAIIDVKINRDKNERFLEIFEFNKKNKIKYIKVYKG